MKVLKSLYLSVLLTFTEVAESTEACNKEKYRHSLTSLSMFVQLLEPRWEETEHGAQNSNDVHQEKAVGSEMKFIQLI